VTPGFFAVLGIPLLAGRDFTDDDRGGRDLVVVVSESLARRVFPSGMALDRHVWLTDPYFGKPQPRRIVGVVADVDDENVVPGETLTVYHPLRQMTYGGRLFVRAAGDPYALVAPVTRLIREMSADQPVERAATLADVRTEVLAPQRLSAFMLSGFAAVALLIAVVGVAGVLAFTVSARTREFGVRLALGSTHRRLLAQVVSEGALIAAIGTVAGVVGSYGLGRLATSLGASLQLPGALPLLGAAAVLMGAAVVASLMPAARASRVDVVQVLRAE
jgi:putative ABC transport system permease protein